MQTRSTPPAAGSVPRRPRSAYRAHGLVALLAAGALTLAATLVGGTAASASTLGGTATLIDPSTSATLTSGGSTTLFTVGLPPSASCSGDTASDGFHVYSFLVQPGVAVSSLTFVNYPSAGYGIVDTTGLYYGARNTAIGTGQIVGVPDNFEWAPLVTQDGVGLSTLLYTKGKSGTWVTGLACANTNGAVTDYWSTEITFAKGAGDPNGFTWSAAPTLGITTTSLPPATRGSVYTASLQAHGGTAPLAWKKVGKLPKGLKLNKATGVLSGTPSTKLAAGPYPITVTVSDHGKKTARQQATATFSLTVG